MSRKGKELQIKKERIEKKLKFISEMYDLAYEVSFASIRFQQLKDKIEFIDDENALIENSEVIKKQVCYIEEKAKFSKKYQKYLGVAERLKQVLELINQLIKEEYLTVRRRNENPLSVEM